MSPTTNEPLQHEIDVKLASGASLTLLYFSDRELRWIFSYDYVGEKDPGTAPEVVNKVRLVADYAAGTLATQVVLSMHVILPGRLGQEFFAGVDISPGAKTYLEFTYQRTRDEYRLVEICKGARDRVRLDNVGPALIQPTRSPFPIPDCLPVKFGTLHVPFRTNRGDVAHFELPTRTHR